MSTMKILAGACVSGVLLTGLAAPADAGVTRTYRNLATGYCLDSNAARAVYTLGCNGGSYQKWDVSGTDSATVFRNLATGFCLDSNTDGRVYTLRCNGGSFQKWRVYRYSDGVTMRFRNVATGRCLDSNAARAVYTLACNGGSYQKWRR